MRVRTIGAIGAGVALTLTGAVLYAAWLIGDALERDEDAERRDIGRLRALP